MREKHASYLRGGDVDESDRRGAADECFLSDTPGGVAPAEDAGVRKSRCTRQPTAIRGLMAKRWATAAKYHHLMPSEMSARNKLNTVSKGGLVKGRSQCEDTSPVCESRDVFFFPSLGTAVTSDSLVPPVPTTE